MSGKRIFTKEELAEFSKDCMDLALEALEKGDVEKAKKWCRKQKETKDCIHDLYLHWITALLSTIYDRWGEESAVSVLKETSCLGPSGWSSPFLAERDRLIKEKGMRGWIEYIMDVWRQHTMHTPPGMTMEEDDEKFILTMNPCGSGGRLINMGAYDGAFGYRKLKKAGPHTWGEENVPIYCAHCPIVHEAYPVNVAGPGAQFWIHASPFPKKPGDPCIYYIYKDPTKIPAKYYDRIGKKKPA